MKTILFHTNHLSIRGSEVALYDYAYHNQTILGNKSVVVYDRNHPDNNPEVTEKFRRAFALHAYSNFEEIDPLIARLGCDVFYIIKWGFRDGKVARDVPTLVHSVFPTPIEEVHGTVFAFISEWLSKTVNGAVPFVPHMINLPQHNMTLRAKLGIPANATVFGSYGGHDSFDVPFVPECVHTALARRSDLHFLFMNYPRFLTHECAHFFQGTSNLEFKTAFINTSDAMLHARERGETFGLACGEFSSRNKPILTWGGSPERGHLEILGDSARVYNDAKELLAMLTDFDRTSAAKGIWNAYAEKFSPDTVMAKFQTVFLDPISGNTTAS